MLVALKRRSDLRNAQIRNVGLLQRVQRENMRRCRATPLDVCFEKRAPAKAKARRMLPASHSEIRWLLARRRNLRQIVRQSSEQLT